MAGSEETSRNRGQEPSASLRWTPPGSPPTRKELECWLGKTAHGLWQRVEKMIADRYPGTFTPEWLYGGKKHGWSVRYKKGKSFCTMVPEKGRCLLVIVFGAEERAKVEGIRGQLSTRVQNAYDQATTYHDGKWLLLQIDDKEVLADAEVLLAMKRKPTRAKR